MGKFRWLLLLVGLGLVASALLFLLPGPEKSPINREELVKIKSGLTLEEVEALVGVPPGDYSDGPLSFDYVFKPDFDDAGLRALGEEFTLKALGDASSGGNGRAANVVGWVTNSDIFYVVLNEAGNVEEKFWLPVRRSPESVLEKLTRWFGWF